MGLPKQQHAIYSLTIPSTKETVKFRPFTVKEDNILTQAKESEDGVVISNAVLETLSNCLLGKVDVKKLATFDLEFLLTNIRAKSVGEKIDLLLTCSKSENHKKTVVQIDLTEPQVVFPPKHTNKIDLYDNVGIIMKYPSIGDLLKLETSSALDAVILCIETIYDGEEIHKAKEYPYNELKDFVESLSEGQMKKVKELFFDSIPTYQLDIVFNCIECGEENRKTITGLNNFFI